MREHGRATRQKISFDLRLSIPTVTQNLEYLTEQGLLTSEIISDGRPGGRNPLAYTYISDARVAIGIDITKHHVKTVVVDLDGNIIKYVYRRRTYERKDAYFRQLGADVEEIIGHANIDRNKVLGVSIAVPGIVDHKRGYVVDGRVINNTGLTCDDFAKYIPFPAKLIHDSDASGFSEVWKNPDMHNAFYISLCNTVGGSVFINDNVYLGDGLFSGELGHLRIHQNGKQCYCGQKGCLDPYCNAEVLSNLTGGDLHQFFEKLQQGDSEFKKVWENYLDNLAIAISDIRMLFGCPIIIGGYVGPYMKDYMDELWFRLDEMSPFGERASHFVFPCVNKSESVATGAALYFIEDFLNQSLALAEKNHAR
ncbi:MAG: hypothetical protein PWP10_2942 [Clostridiales bacterium]|nr:hypothetical protein [Clostridiales bacterium]